MLQTCEEVLNQIVSGVEMAVEFARSESIGLRQNHCLGTSSLDLSHELVGIVALVGYHGLSQQILDQCRVVVDISDLSGGENDVRWTPQRIDGNVQFGRQSATQTADYLSAHFLAPVECWWVETMVESMNSCSMSALPPSTSATHSQMPLSHQRPKRTYVLCQSPQFMRQL